MVVVGLEVEQGGKIRPGELENTSVADLLWVEISSKPLQATMRIAECTSATEPTTFSCGFTRMLGGTKTTNLVLLERQRNGFGERMKSRVQSFNSSDQAWQKFPNFRYR
jgi:hypothetical protein